MRTRTYVRDSSATWLASCTAWGWSTSRGTGMRRDGRSTGACVRCCRGRGCCRSPGRDLRDLLPSQGREVVCALMDEADRYVSVASPGAAHGPRVSPYWN